MSVKLALGSGLSEESSFPKPSRDMGFAAHPPPLSGRTVWLRNVDCGTPHPYGGHGYHVCLEVLSQGLL